MSQTFTCTKEHNVTLPKHAIYDYIADEYIDVETVMEVKDELGRVKDLEYSKKQNIKGLMLAWPDEENKLIRIGYSRCHTSDKFNMVDAINVALERGNTKYEYIVFDEVREFETQFMKFRDRVKKYYKQLMFKEWRMFRYLEKCQSPTITLVSVDENGFVRMKIPENFNFSCNRNNRIYTPEAVGEAIGKIHEESKKCFKNKTTTVTNEGKNDIVHLIISGTSHIDFSMIKFNHVGNNSIHIPGDVVVTVRPK